MSEPLEDTQSQPDRRGVPIPQVGIRGLRYPVTILRPDGTLFSSTATAELTADLAATERGTHMSRFVTLLHERRGELTPERLLAATRELRDRLQSSDARIVLSLPWFAEKKAPVTGAPGFVDYQVIWDSTVKGPVSRLLTTVVVPIATVCPCSKAISDRGAHNQRGELTFTVDADTALWPDDLIRLAEASASCELYSVLKRPDEKAVTEQAYDNPVFVEDVVRNAAIIARKHAGIRAFRVTAENFESIHHHNACAMVEEGW